MCQWKKEIGERNVQSNTASIFGIFRSPTKTRTFLPHLILLATCCWGRSLIRSEGKLRGGGRRQNKLLAQHWDEISSFKWNKQMIFLFPALMRTTRENLIICEVHLEFHYFSLGFKFLLTSFLHLFLKKPMVCTLSNLLETFHVIGPAMFRTWWYTR